ncbi:MAG: helix-turn-helix transcriptional regulator [Actinobacteria bacterium]|nr:helix-turn-helix transcriptional regulator [Actinomycetota bacterium]
MASTDRHSAAADLLRALANPYRVRIVELIAAEPRCVHELVEALDAEQPLVSQHLRILRDAHLLTAQRRGREMVYSLADDHIAHIVGDAILHANENPDV